MKSKSTKSTITKSAKLTKVAAKPKLVEKSPKVKKLSKPPVENIEVSEPVSPKVAAVSPLKSSSKIDLRSVWIAKKVKQDKVSIPDVYLVGEEPVKPKVKKEKLHKTSGNPIAERKSKKSAEKKVETNVAPVRTGVFKELIVRKLEDETEIDEELESTPPTDWLLAYDQFMLVFVPKKDIKGKTLTIEDFVSKAAETLETAWASRVVSFAVFDTGFRKGNEKVLLIGARLTKKYGRSVTQGPVANQIAAHAFRQFYGEKSELRKMLDGSICEAVVWFDENSNGAPYRRAELLVTIAKHVLNKHVAPVKMSLRRFEFDHVYTPIADYTPVTNAFERLSTAIRALKDLPLVVSDIHCTSSFWRRTEPFPPTGRFSHVDANWSSSEVLSDNIARLVDAKNPKPKRKDKNAVENGAVENDAEEEQEEVEEQLLENLSTPFFSAALPVMLTLEHSGKFGDTLQIIAKFKVAFYIEIAERLKTNASFFTVPTDNCLYVVIDNIAFKIEIGQGKEIALAKRLEDEKKASQLPPGIDWRTLKHKFQYLPQMSTQIQGLSQRFAAFGPTCQLLKRFLASHCLLDHFEDVAVELLVSATFLKLDSEHGWPPMDPMAGFTHCLALLATHDFAKEPIFIDFNGELTDEKIVEHRNTFLATRPILPSLVIYTSDDDSGIRFTRSGPELPVFSRVVDLASNALIVIRKHIEFVITSDASKLLTSSMDDYDAVVSLESNTVVFTQKAYNANKAFTAKHKDKTMKQLLPVVNFNPAADFFDDLKRMLNDFALFFYDRYGGRSIGVMFRPSFLAPIEFKANKQMSCRKRDQPDANEFSVNKDEFVETIRIIGNGIVKTVHLKNEETS